MNDTVSWILSAGIKAGELENFKDLMAEMVEATAANEPDTLIYEFFISEDGSSCHVYERYANSAATMTHLGAFGEKFADRFLGMVEPTGLSVYGNPSDDVRQALVPFGAAHLTQIGGFAR